MLGWYLNVMCGSVGVVGLKNVILKPGGSCVLFGVGVVLGLPCCSGGLWCGNVECWGGGVRVVFESAVIGGILVLPGIGSDVKVLGNEIGWSSVGKV